MFPSINIRKRRSKLGRRSLVLERPSVPAPVFAVPSVSSGLGRNRSDVVSAKKTPMSKASKEYFVRKKLFLNRSPNDGFLSLSLRSQSRGSPSISMDRSNSSLDVTGVRSINTPSPDVRSFQSGSSNCHVPHSRGESSSNAVTKHDFYNEPKVNDQRKSTVNPYMYDPSKPPLSPGPSKYEALIRKELDNLKPPVDPGDNVHMKKFLESLTSSSIEKHLSNNHSDPHIPTTCSAVESLISSTSESKCTAIQKELKTYSVTADKLCVIQEDDINEDSSFLLAEQTILGNNQTFKEPEAMRKENGTNLTESTASTQDDEELQEAVVAIDRGISGLEQTLKDMKQLKIKVLQLINKGQQLESGNTKMNKENIPANAEKKWFASLKTGNPGLLKTPNMSKQKIAKSNLLNQSTILTPHSLSTVLNDQMEDLYSDEYY